MTTRHALLPIAAFFCLLLGQGCDQPIDYLPSGVQTSTQQSPTTSGPQGPSTSVPTTTAQGKRYLFRSLDECSRARFTCEATEQYFADAQGCGCEPKTASEDTFCAAVYQPVCAEIEVQCVRAPCNNIFQTFGNECEARRTGFNIKQLKSGECQPSPSTPTTSAS